MKKLIYLILLIAIVAGGYWYYQNNIASQGNAEASKQANMIGAQIVWVEGGVEYKQGEGDWKRASVDISLKEGDSVETLADGRAIINFDDGSAIRLDNKSKVVLASLKPEHMTVKNESGQVYSRVAKSVRIFDVQAGSVVYESLGTAYKTVNKSDQKGVEVYESKVKVIDADKKETVVDEGNKYLLENKADVKIEKKLVKISETDIKKDAFVAWNRKQDQAIIDSNKDAASGQGEAPVSTTATEVEDADTSVAPVPVSPAALASKITLSAAKTASGLKFTWTVSGVDVEQGFKLVKGAEANPVYPGNDYQYLTNKDQRSYTWGIKDGKTYYFRICQYLDGKCGVYSNNVKITAPVVETAEKPDNNIGATVSSIVLSSAGSGKVAWKASGVSEQGFKLVWSKNTGPTYPCREGDKYNYYSDAGTISGSIDAFDGAGTYYVRVCQYLGGKCGVYSNQITLTLE